MFPRSTDILSTSSLLQLHKQVHNTRYLLYHLSSWLSVPYHSINLCFSGSSDQFPGVAQVGSWLCDVICSSGKWQNEPTNDILFTQRLICFCFGLYLDSRFPDLIIVVCQRSNRNFSRLRCRIRCGALRSWFYPAGMLRLPPGSSTRSSLGVYREA